MVGRLCCLGPVVGMCVVTARERERRRKSWVFLSPFKATYPMTWKLSIRPGMANLGCQLVTLGTGISYNCFHQIACGHVWGVHFCISLITIEVGVPSPLWAGGTEQSMSRCVWAWSHASTWHSSTLSASVSTFQFLLEILPWLLSMVDCNL